MAVFDGNSGRAEEPVSGGCDPGKRRTGNLTERLIQEAVREELKCGDVGTDASMEKEEIPGQMLDFLFQMEQE